METIIQIIIILVIIASVMKRFREIAGKSKDLETTKLPKPVLDLFEVETPEEEPPARPFAKPRFEPSPEMRPKPRPGTPSWEESRPVGESTTFEEETLESRSEIQVPESRFPDGMTQAGGSMPEIRAYAERPRMMRSPERRPHIPVLRFHQTQVVRGIIMSEILGPPVGLRDRERFISGIV